MPTAPAALPSAARRNPPARRASRRSPSADRSPGPAGRQSRRARRRNRRSMPQPRPTSTGGTLVEIRRAFHIAAKVSAATTRLSGCASPIAREHAGEGNVVIIAQHVAELHQKQQHRGHVLEARHHGMRREFYQRAQPQQAEQRLKQPAEQDDGEKHQQRGGDAGCGARRGGRDATAKTAAGRGRMSW